MTIKHRLRVDQLQVGTPLPVDVYDAENRLLLRRGNVISTQSQLERLIESGMFTSQALPARGASEPAAKPRGDDPFVDGPLMRPSVGTKTAKRVSVFSEMLKAGQSLETLLRSPQSAEDFVGRIEAIADSIIQACSLDADAALAHVLFAPQLAYCARQSINVAIVTALLLARMNHESARTRSAVCASLTMNTSISALLDQLYQQKDLDAAQSAQLAAHPTASATLLRSIGVADSVWITLVQQHHEFVDGSGYPNQLKGSAVLLEAQVMGLADRYCGAVTERAYRQALPPGVVLKQIRESSGAAIDAKLISGLVFWVGIYPPGTVVELANRDVAVVTRRLQDLKNPMVYAVAGDNHQPFELPRRRATGTEPQFKIERVLPRDTIKFAVDPETLWPGVIAQSDEATEDKGYVSASS